MLRDEAVIKAFQRSLEAIEGALMNFLKLHPISYSQIGEKFTTFSDKAFF